MRRRTPALPSTDLAGFAPVVRRTLLVRAALVAAIAAALLAAAAGAREPYVRSGELLPEGTNGMVVLDVSASIASQSQTAELLPGLYPNPNRRIAAVLRAIAERGDPAGLVMFSDVAYELLPPVAPGRELARLIQLFAPVSDGGPFAAGSALVPTPWAESLTGGTLISPALTTALDAFRRDGVERPSIVLVSDLDAPGDVTLPEVLARIRDERVPMRIVSLAEGDEAAEAFTRILGEDVLVTVEELEPGRSFPLGSADVERLLQPVSPMLLVVLAAAVMVLLGAHEGLFARLPLPREERR